MKVAVSSGADTVMDLSIAGDISGFRKENHRRMQHYPRHVPIYEAMIGLEQPEDLTIEHFLEVVEKQAKEGGGLHDHPFGGRETAYPLCGSTGSWCRESRRIHYGAMDASASKRKLPVRTF